jgi:hypothetical protein
MPDFDIPEPHFVAEHLEVARTLLCFFLHDETRLWRLQDETGPPPSQSSGKA